MSNHKLDKSSILTKTKKDNLLNVNTKEAVHEWIEENKDPFVLYEALIKEDAVYSVDFLLEYLIESGFISEKALEINHIIFTLDNKAFKCTDLLLNKYIGNINKKMEDGTIVAYLETFKEIELFEKYESKMNEDVLDEFMTKKLKLIVK